MTAAPRRRESRQMVKRLNSKLDGWANYLCLGPVSKAGNTFVTTPVT